MTRRTGLIVLALAVALVGSLVIGGLGLNPLSGSFQVLNQSRLVVRGLDAYNQVKRKASEGYDVRLARARGFDAIKAYQARNFAKTNRLIDAVFDSLKRSKKVGYRIFYRSAGNVTVSGLVFEPPLGNMPWRTIVVSPPGFGSAADFSDVALAFRDRGYLAFCQDYRGSGESQGKHELARGEVDDAINGIKYLKAKGLVDDNRIGLCGLSHGASVAMIVAGRYPGVRAVVEEAGFTDLAGAYRYHLKSSPKVRKTLESYSRVIGGSPDEFPKEYAVRSPITYVNSIHAPILIIHGAKDPLVPVSQAEEMYKALRDKGKVVSIKIYPDQGHGVTGAEPRAEVWRLTFAWFDKYV